MERRRVVCHFLVGPDLKITVLLGGLCAGLFLAEEQRLHKVLAGFLATSRRGQDFRNVLVGGFFYF